ncbi:hypothetical protein K788_0007806 [Paraburkholderia caribensis MBA4]|uniref:Uncharacterized protein n=1 Tax=Paraburkholderia caribensis MBA4 TaxID=1323664 RepID=A0A0P0R8I6_9BURK|nr:hypothetical protein K788_0007806 [Paraburkholderia caribensis MBA4]
MWEARREVRLSCQKEKPAAMRVFLLVLQVWLTGMLATRSALQQKVLAQMIEHA